MDSLQALLNWFAGGSKTPYMNLYHCMAHDVPWVAITMALDLAVAAGYLMIAYHWQQNQRLLADSEARKPLNNLRNIFLFCGLCGYLFIPIKMVWPAWRLYDFFMMALVFFTWRYAWGARDLKVVFRQLHRSSELEQQLATARELAERKRFFLNAISHDLRNPVHAVSIHAAVAKAAMARGDRAGVDAALETIGEAVRQTAELLEDFTDIGRLERGPGPGDAGPGWVTVDAGALARDLADRLGPTARQKGLRLLADADRAGLAFEVADEARLRRVLTNLITNAVKYTQQGRVTVRATGAERVVRFDVEDTGPGIPPQHMERIFDEFYQADNPNRDRANGFGLGLAIAKRFTESLGGRHWVESQHGEGSRFCVEFPRTGAGDGREIGLGPAADQPQRAVG